MADLNDKNLESGETSANQQGIQPAASQNVDSADFAKLADATSSEGSSINSEDYWFLKLNGNC